MRLAIPTLLMLAATASACRDPAASGSAGARDRILAVGSSTVFPFTAAIAERFARNAPDAAAPVVESTGTGAGLRLFCGGIGAGYPDVVGASRRMRPDEVRACAAHGVRDVLAVPIGRDGLAFAQAIGAPPLRLNDAAIYRALAYAPGGRPNRARLWRDVDPSLPATPIRVYGPPPTSGTRDALATLVLARGCVAVDPAAAALPPAAFHDRCTRVREDGAYADAGEHDNVVVQKLGRDPHAIGVFGYAYLAANRATLRGIPLDGVAPTPAAIASGAYPGTRRLVLYVKSAHLAAVPGLAGFVRLYAAAAGANGPLVRHGLIAEPPAPRAAMLRDVAAATGGFA